MQASNQPPDEQADGDAGETVVVTAQLREQRPVEVPFALTTYSARFLEDLNIQEFEDLARFTPGFAAVPPSRTNELWVTNTDAGKIVFHETASETRIADVTTAAGAHALAFAPDGTKAFVTNQLSASVSVIDAQTRAVETTIPVGEKPNGIVYRAR